MKNTKDQDLTKVELLLTVNENIIVQRFFNVRNYNPDAKNSMELQEVISGVKNHLMNYLKMKTVVYMMDNKYEIETNPQIMETSFTDGPEHLNIYIKVDGVTVCHRGINVKVFPPKVRYTVDIRPQLKTILTDLTDIFSSENLSYEYNGVMLTA